VAASPTATEKLLAVGPSSFGLAVVPLVASTATGGAFAAALGDNSVKLVFGQTEHDAQQIVLAYEHFAFPNVRTGLPDVLRRYNNVVTLWHVHPQDSDLSLVVGCLR